MTGDQTLSAPSHERAHPGWGSAMLAPAAATTVVYTPSLLFRPDLWDNMPGYVVVAWFVALVLAAPVTVMLVNRRRPVTTRWARSWLLGLTQLPLVVGLMWIDIWLDVRSGYLIAGSGEVEMALGFGTVMAVGVGLLLAVLVYAAGRFGATRQPSSPPSSASRVRLLGRILNPRRAQTNPPSTPSTTLYSLSSPVFAQLQ